MGSSQSHFSEKQLEYYHKECTFLSKSEIVRIYKKFRSLDPAVPEKYEKSYRAPYLQMKGMKELLENPFRDRILRVFSCHEQGGMTFDEFLDLHTVFNNQTPEGVKIAYLFKIYDMDNDSKLNRDDLKKVLSMITDDTLREAEMTEIIDKVFQESNWNGDDALDFYEFEQILIRAPYFLRGSRARYGYAVFWNKAEMNVTITLTTILSNIDGYKKGDGKVVHTSSILRVPTKTLNIRI